jgi:hypothetical protein
MTDQDEITFTDPVTMTIGELEPGDWLITIPQQLNMRAAHVEQGIKTLTDDYATLETHYGKGRGHFRQATHCKRITFNMSARVLVVPADFTCTARKIIHGGE